ncbi:MAG: hypothetical protein HY927_06515 [Elusimicrobia bacterium]|nr:hypothetical protein [Elusimicrobiota bacterium]
MLSPSILLACLAALGPAVGAVPTQEAWSAERLDSLFDGALAAAGTPLPVPAQAAGVSPGAAPDQAAAAPDSDPGKVSPVKGVSSTGRVNLSGPDEDAGKSPVSPMGLRPPVDEIPNSDWRTVGHIEDAIADQNPSSREKQDFWDKLRNQAFWHDVGDQLCQQAKIPLDYALKVGDHLSGKPGFQRSLRTGVDGKIVLVDRAELRLSLGGSLKATELAGSPVSVSAGVDIIGMSMVARTLKGAKACRELDELVDFRTIKMVYPLEADRFEKMEVGELWSMPLVMRASFGAGVGYPVAGVTPVTVSFGYSREGGVNVTLRRLDKDSLRVRIRIDYARVHGPGVGLDYTVTGTHWYEEYRVLGRDLAKDSMGELIGEKLVFNALDRNIRRELEKFLALRLRWLTQWVREDHALIEFILNPNDKEQMKGLEELLAGGRLEVIDSMYKRFKTAGMAFLDMKDLKDQMPDLRKSYDEALRALETGVRSFTGTDRAESLVHSFRLKFPILFDYSRNAGKRDDKITVLDDAGGEFGIYRAHKESSKGFLSVPFLGQLFNYNARRSVMTFTHKDKDGAALPPSVIFVHQEGYTKQSEDNARSLAVEVSEIMQLAGTRGQGVNPRTALPLDKVFPMTPRQDTPWTEDGPPARDTGPSYARGMGAFTVVLGEKAISDILNAKPEEVIRAFVAASDSYEKEALRWAVANGKVASDGAVDFDWRKSPYYRPWSPSDENQSDPEGDVRRSLRDAGKLVRRLQEARALRPDGSSDPGEANRQAQALRDIVGSGAGGMAYDDIMKVLVQLTDAKNVSAEFVVSAKPGEKKKPVVEGRYLLNKGLEEDRSLTLLAEVSNKFNPPSEYSD